MKGFGFKIGKQLGGTLARMRVIKIPHGEIMTPEQVSGVGAQAVLANAYHLYLQPGHKIVQSNLSQGLIHTPI